MKKQRVGCIVWIILACLLYFFENNTGTRIVLFCSVLLPLLPALRRGLFGLDAIKSQPRATLQTVRAFADRAADEPGDVRPYQPGDPVNRIHWKLSAKRDELLVRQAASGRAVEEEKNMAAGEADQPAVKHWDKRIFLICFAVFLAALIVVFALPAANQGLKALLNRLFDASEAVNAYAYDHFAVLPGASEGWAIGLLSVMALSLLGMTLASGSRLPALLLMAGCVLFQVYLGLSFPAGINVLLFALFSFRMLKRPWKKQAVFSLAAGIGCLALMLLMIWPGVDPATEAASEAVRDRLSQMAQAVSGFGLESNAWEHETRHVLPQSLTMGDQEAQPDREYHLLTLEEEQISRPRWVNYLRILLLLLLTVAVVTLPFLPFAILNRRRKRALDARMAFQSQPVNDAVFAIFQHVIAWLEATGNGAGNLPYALWRAELCPGYAERFAQCEKLFEEAAYSTHEMREDQRQQALELLHETERTLQRKADWRQRLRLKYKEWLWV